MNPFKTKRGLGRGLSSLIGDSNPVTTKNKISVSYLLRNKFQPRKNFNKESLDDLTNSIKERGVIQPIIVRISEDQKNKYEIVAGERRWLAAQNAGLHEVPVVIIEANDLVCSLVEVEENLVRSELNAIQTASEAFAKETSVSVTIPIYDKIILGFIS